MKYPVIVAAITLLAGACSPDNVGDPGTDTGRVWWTTGVDATVRLVGVEGGCWVLDVGDQNYQPTNLPADYRVDGLRVRVRFRELRDAASFCMVGPIVSIENISKR